ncbi:SMC-Scp complex subunit ScpB [Thalassobacillus sp. CUG 92003]|uniref:SMC-Scp complex subunit ScpB n=1 Tax=Thalassobacillus sp. CUG 92003 TaxID=2736641 RepID=UPI0015E710AD|nr:SMC-Scp complex subunit ScpB [Thalassobacillus sp. CUG 92003]
MKLTDYQAIIEGLLFAAGDEGLSARQMAKLLEVEMDTVYEAIEGLKEAYQQPERGISLMVSNQVYHMTTKKEHAPYYAKLVDAPQSTRLSQAALETLAIIAYQQPITRIEIDDLRGVKSERAIHTLTTRHLIYEVGRKEAVGRPILYGTTADFLSYFGLGSLEELPPLTDLEQHDSEVEDEADLFFQSLSESPLSSEDNDA